MQSSGTLHFIESISKRAKSWMQSNAAVAYPSPIQITSDFGRKCNSDVTEHSNERYRVRYIDTVDTVDDTVDTVYRSTSTECTAALLVYCRVINWRLWLKKHKWSCGKQRNSSSAIVGIFLAPRHPSWRGRSKHWRCSDQFLVSESAQFFLQSSSAIPYWRASSAILNWKRQKRKSSAIHYLPFDSSCAFVCCCWLSAILRGLVFILNQWRIVSDGKGE